MSIFSTNPNQRIIKVLKEGKAVCDTDHLYIKVQKEAMIEAMKALTPTTFQVWLYLASQKADYTFAFSPAAVTVETGIKKSSLQEGIRVLINEGYLIQRKDNSNIYDFYEIPREKVEEQEEEIIIHTQSEGFIF